MPEGFGRAFCGALHKSLFQKAGGWDEDYRDGAGWEDIDWAQRLKRAGAVPVIRDDLTVIHPKKGATIRWGADQFARNRALYEQKWGLVHA
jgi:GT2 family glycosyltransferase